MCGHLKKAWAWKYVETTGGARIEGENGKEEKLEFNYYFLITNAGPRPETATLALWRVAVGWRNQITGMNDGTKASWVSTNDVKAEEDILSN